VVPTSKTKLAWWILLNAFLAPSMWAQRFEADADRIVSPFAKRGEFRGTVMVARNGQVLFQKGYGNAGVGDF
jgi:CubicO group peptidase (beta-lactamase class C family)